MTLTSRIKSRFGSAITVSLKDNLLTIERGSSAIYLDGGAWDILQATVCDMYATRADRIKKRGKQS